MKLASVTTAIALAFLLVFPMVLTGCTSKAEPTAVETAISALASGGVAVYDSYAAKAPVAHVGGPASAMRYTRFQLRNMVGQAQAGMGMTGAALNAFDRTPPAQAHAPGFSAFLGAWLKRSQGPLATYAASFMPKTTDYAHTANIVFPVLVVTLFIADAARPKQTAAIPEPEHFEWQRLIAAPASAAGTCSSVTDFVSSVVDEVTKALQVSGDGFFATLWNVIVAKGVDVVVGVLKTVLKPIIAIIKTVASVLAMVTVIASSLQAWTVKVVADPEQVTMLGTAVDGKFTATVDNGSIPWPDELKNCAKALADVDLDSLTSIDAPVSWETSGQVPESATVTDSDKKIGADKTATLNYKTVALSDPQKEDCSTLEHRGNIGARATVERSDITKLQVALTNASVSLLPDFVQKGIMPLLKPWLESQMQSFTNLLSAPVSGYDAAMLMENKKDPAKCTPAPNAPSPAASAPLVKATPGDQRIAGNWSCIISKHIVSSGIAVDIDTHVEYDLAPNGVAVIKFPNGSSGTFGPGGGNVQADKNMTAQAPGSYTYTGTAAGGTLHMSNGASSGDEVIKFANANAFSTTLSSPQNKETFPMHCKRM